MLLYVVFLIVYVVKLLIFLLYIWLFDVYGEVIVFVYMLLVGILLKMGGYVLLWMNVGMLLDVYVMFVFVLVILGVVNIVYVVLILFV